jgi:hypothetical protein
MATKAEQEHAYEAIHYVAISQPGPVIQGVKWERKIFESN